MATRTSTIDALQTVLAPVKPTFRKMFGEYGLYCDGKFVGVVADDSLFLKRTPAGLTFLDESHLCPAYPGATPSLRVPDERWEDAAWVCAMVRATAAALPVPKPKKAG